MPKKSKEELEKLRQESSWKNNLFSRYMLFRYSLALFFFANIYWILTGLYRPSIYLILPLAGLCLSVVATAEQFRLYGKKEPVLTHTKFAFQGQGLISLLALLVSLVPGQFSLAYPAFADTLTGKSFIASLLVLGLITVAFNLKRVKEVEEKRDKFYHRFKQSFGHLD